MYIRTRRDGRECHLDDTVGLEYQPAKSLV